MTEDPTQDPGHVVPDTRSETDRPATTTARHVAPGGFPRMVIGFACGLAAGALVALLLPRDDGPRRGTRVSNDVVPDASEPFGASRHGAPPYSVS